MHFVVKLALRGERNLLHTEVLLHNKTDVGSLHCLGQAMNSKLAILGSSVKTRDVTSYLCNQHAF